jgi:excisionase family DNA binding protein
MSKHPATRKEIKRRPGRAEVVRARRAASKMASVEDLAADLGIGLNLAYSLVQAGVVPSMRLGRRYLIPRPVIAKIVSGEMVLNVGVATATAT